MKNLILCFIFPLLVSTSISNAQPFAAFDKASEEVLNDPHDLAFGPDGMLYIADKFGSRIVVMDPETLTVERVILEGKLPGVHDIAFAGDGSAAIAITSLGIVAVFPDLLGADPQPSLTLAASRTEGAAIHPDGTIYAMAGGFGQLIAYRGEEVVATAAGLSGAHDVAIDLEGNVWAADNFSRRLVKYSPSLELLKVLDDPKYGFAGPRYMDVDPQGRLLVADQDAHSILLIDPDAGESGELLGVLGDGFPGKGPNQFDDPEGVVVRDGRIFIADSDNNRIVRYVSALF